MEMRDLERLYRRGVLTPLDYHFACFITELSGDDNNPELFLAAALVSRFTGQGHVCLDLPSNENRVLLEAENGEGPVGSPPLDAWRRKIESSAAVGRPGDLCPLILDDKSRLYLFRYWEYENVLASFIRKNAAEIVENVDQALLEAGLERYFPDSPANGLDWQRVAARTCVVRKFCVISGGPGTGKTTTVAKVLALLLEQANGKKFRIALATPTGKAAARLEEAIRSARAKLCCADSIKEAIPEEASTIHRLLGTIPDSPYFRHDSENPLGVDAVVVDEASMVDLALMAKLVSAMPKHARLILLGDKDQLASVEAGAVLGDICDTGSIDESSEDSRDDSRDERKEGTESRKRKSSGPEGEPGIRECIVQLRKSYRFGEGSGIGELSHAIRRGDAEQALSLLRDGGCKDIAWFELPRPGALARNLREIILEGFSRVLSASTVDEMFGCFERFRILCALRKGPYGVAALNSHAERILLDEKLIGPGRWYRGRPIMITRNDYTLKLFNGDIGLILPDDRPGASPDPASGAPALLKTGPEMRAFFPAGNGPSRKYPPARLPAHETVYAMTIHKSQGSEFDEVLILLPEDDSPVLTRELLYTAITRARKKVTIWGTANAIRTAVSSRIRRSSGLRDAIWTTQLNIP